MRKALILRRRSRLPTFIRVQPCQPVYRISPILNKLSYCNSNLQTRLFSQPLKLFAPLPLFVHQFAQLQFSMSKELQDKILRLQSEKAQQQSEFMQKKQHYESIILSLQGQNEKLRKYIEENSESFSLIESQAKSQGPVKSRARVDSPVREYEHSKNIPDDQKQKIPQYEQISIQNRMLKQQLSDLTRTYQQQIEQMTNYFNKIQEAYTSITQKLTNLPKEGQINDLVNAYENLLKDFESERLKYIGKIEELTNYIVQSQEKYKQMEQESSKLEIELKIVKEELKIYKRSKIVK